MVWYGAPPTPWTAIVATRWWQLDRAPAEHAQTESAPSALVRRWVSFPFGDGFLWKRNPSPNKLATDICPVAYQSFSAHRKCLLEFSCAQYLTLNQRGTESEIRKGCLLDRRTACNAAICGRECGQLALLQWARPWLPMGQRNAAMDSHLSVLQWACANIGCPWCWPTCYSHCNVRRALRIRRQRIKVRFSILQLLRRL
jgi:hypothetical protein